MSAEESSTVASAPRLSFVDFATLAITFFSLGVTLQVLLLEVDTPPVRAFVASSVIFSATAQFAYLAVRDAGGGELAAIIAGLIVATRFGILAISLAPRLPRGAFRRVTATLNAFDPNVAVAVQQETPEGVEREFWRTTAGMWIGWFPGIAIGSFLGDILGDISRFGLDAVFPAALLAIIGNLLRTRDGRNAALAAGVLTIVLIPILPAGLPIILSLIGVPIAIVFANATSKEPAT